MRCIVRWFQRYYIEIICILALLLTGLAWSGFDRRAINSDTLGYLSYAESIAMHQVHYTDNSYPFFPYMIALAVKCFGSTLASVHFFPWIFSGITPLLLYLVWRQRGGSSLVGVLMALLYMGFPLQSAKMNGATTEPIFTAFLVLNLLIFSVSIRRAWGVTLLLMTMSILMLIRYDSVLWCVIVFLAWCYKRRFSRSDILWLVLGVMLAGAIQMPFAIENIRRSRISVEMAESKNALSNNARMEEVGQGQGGMSLILNMLPMGKIKAWAGISSSKKTVSRNLDDGVLLLHNATSQMKMVAGTAAFLLLVLCLLSLGVFGLIEMCQRQKDRFNFVMVLYLVFYMGIAVFFIKGSVLRHLSRVVPLVVVIMGAGVVCLMNLRWWKERRHYQVTFSFFLVLVFLLCSGFVNHNYKEYRSDIAMLSMWQIMSKPYDLMIEKSEGSNISHRSSRIEFHVLQEKIAEHYGCYPGGITTKDGDDRTRFDFDFGKGVIDSGNSAGVVEIMATNPDFFRNSDPYFLGIEGLMTNEMLFIKVEMEREVSAVTISDSHITAYRGDQIELAVSWDEGENWGMLYRDDGTSRFPVSIVVDTHNVQIEESRSFIIRYIFTTGKCKNAASGLWKSMSIMVHHDKE